MVHVTFRLLLLLMLFLLRQTSTVSDQCGELQSEISRLSKLNHRNELLAGQCYVSGYYAVHVSSLSYTHTEPNVM